MTPYWQNIQTAHSKIPFVIVNANSGPGTSANSDYQAQISRNTNNGTRSIGYVDTSYQTRPMSDVIGDVRKWKELYPETTGYLLDQVDDATPAQVCYLATAYNYIKVNYPQDLVVNNFGADVSDSVIPYGDIFSTFENTASYYLNSYSIPTSGFMANPENSNRIYHIIHSTDASQYAAVHAKTIQANAGWTYITSDGMPNPYDDPSTLWDSFVSDTSLLPNTAIPNYQASNLPHGCVSVSAASSKVSEDITSDTAVVSFNLALQNAVSALQSLYGNLKLTFTLPKGVTVASNAANVSCSGAICTYTNESLAPSTSLASELALTATCEYGGEPVVYEVVGSNTQLFTSGQLQPVRPNCPVAAAPATSVDQATGGASSLAPTGQSFITPLVAAITAVGVAAVTCIRLVRRKTD